ncbi:uncharacterized protein N7479_005461 [Penicillium vulpinum]|nr:uncharacterized protein N7479_005461 [Penicillium vulpinum]KAJ5958311.1 hypothetical protein N7479_005461 [Penicillium vulpinum]
MDRDEKNIFSEFEDEERKQLVAEIITQDPSLATLPRSSFFSLWFSDIRILRHFAKVQEEDPTFAWRTYTLGNVNGDDIPGIVAGGKQVNKSSSKGKASFESRLPRAFQGPASRSRSMSPEKAHPGLRDRSINLPRTSWDDHPAPPHGQAPCLVQPDRQKRDDVIKKKCLERDDARCILTKRDQPGLHCAHIVPFKLNGFSASHSSWSWLRVFWGREVADKWMAELLNGSNQPNLFNTEQVKNLITLGSQEHNYWDNGIFAFRPVRTYQQNTKMDIAFHWLPPRGSEKQTDHIPTLSHPYPSHPQGYGTSPGGNRYLFHCETLNVIPSGHIFTVTTSNPVTHPLPSEELLTMQWHLSRIASMQGAGEDEDSDLDSDGDSVAVTSGSRSPAKETHNFPEKFVLASPGGSPSKRASIPFENVLSENIPLRHPTQSPPPSKARNLPSMGESSSEPIDK